MENLNPVNNGENQKEEDKSSLNSVTFGNDLNKNRIKTVKIQDANVPKIKGAEIGKVKG